jgi:hypothetical protein
MTVSRPPTTAESTKMTTTSSANASARRPGPLANLKLYLTAFLAGAYLVIWWALGSRLPSSNTAAAPAAAPPAGDAQITGAAVWYLDLPASARPALRLPPGWRIADDSPDSQAADEAPPAPVRAVSERARVRTRSS